MAIPTILDTDIGHDVDDVWALAFLLRCPELEVKLITTSTGDTVYRAKLVAKMAEANDKKEPKVRLPPHLRMCHRVDFIDTPIPQRHHDPSLAIPCAEAAVTAFILRCIAHSGRRERSGDCRQDRGGDDT